MDTLDVAKPNISGTRRNGKFPQKTISSDRIQATAAKYYEKILTTMLPLH